MRVLYLTNAIFPSRAANSVHIMKMCQSFSMQGHVVYLFFLENKHKEEKKVSDIFDFYNVRKVFQIKKIKRFFPGRFSSFQIGLRAIFKKVDIVYSRDALAILLPSLFNKKCILEVHEGINRSWVILILFRILQFLPGFIGLVVISDRLRQHVEEVLPRFKGRVLVAHDAADLFPVNVETYHFKNKKFSVGYMGQLYQGKGVELILRLAPLFPLADFHIVGGYDQDIEYWKDRSRSMKNIHFHGFQQQKKLPSFLKAFDVVLAPYQERVHGFEGKHNLANWMSPLKLFEYMAAEKAIICSDLPVLREILVHKKTAFLCSPHSIESWSEALVLLMESADLRLNLGKEARKQFEKSHTWDMRAKLILSFVTTIKPKHCTK